MNTKFFCQPFLKSTRERGVHAGKSLPKAGNIGQYVLAKIISLSIYLTLTFYFVMGAILVIAFITNME